MMRKFENIVFMKYGVHASESVDSILNRKLEELGSCQKMFWGYGGVICHPTKQVQPFANANFSEKKKTYLLLSETPSKLNNSPSVATHFSRDNDRWQTIEDGIKVLGSKYAIVCKNLEKCNFQIDLSQYVIPVGNSQGKLLSEYVKGRVDKACGQRLSGYVSSNLNTKNNLVHISLYAEIIDPYSVFVK